MSRGMIYLSLAMAFVLQLMPWSGWWRPEFVLLVLLYWLLRAPHLCGIASAWLVGLMLDLVTGVLFGQHALAFTLTAFLALYYQRRLILFTNLQQTGYVFLLLLFNQLVMLLLQAYTGQQHFLVFLISTIFSMLIWHIAHVIWLNRER
jgi:rod shape-determining protein MreD